MTSCLAASPLDRGPLNLLLPAFVVLLGILERSLCATVAEDNASDAAYAAEATGAWKGTGPTEGENPPGMDDGGFGFQPWDFRGGYHDPLKSPYGALNHFVDGVDFPSREANDLGSPAFGLTNAGFAPVDGFFGYTARATRVFDAPLSVGQTLSIDFDNPVPQPLDPFSASGFLFRLNKGGGPLLDSAPQLGIVERFGAVTTSNFNDGRWYTTDSLGFADTGVTPSATSAGATFRFTLTGDEMYEMEFLRLSDGELLVARAGTLNNAGAGPIDSLEITLFSNGSSGTGSREFFFNNLHIEGPDSGMAGDYNGNGVVDAADYAVWRDTLDETVPAGSGADGDGDGVIGPGDYEVWRTNFGRPAAASAATLGSVPEPSTTYLVGALVGVLFLSAGRRRYGAID